MENLDFSLLKTAGLSYPEFADLIGVSRQAIFNWRTGKRAPLPFYAERLDTTLKQIALAIEQGTLPLAVPFGAIEAFRDKRKQAIRSALR